MTSLAWNRLAFLMLCISWISWTGCSNTRRIAHGKPLKNLNVNQVIGSFEEARLQWDWIGMKLDVEVSSDAGTESFKASVRMANDSAIWMSISPALGVEVARVLLQPDSVRFISKVPGNRFYYSGDYEALSDWADTDLNFNYVEDILSGQPMGLTEDETKFISKIDDDSYLLIGKYRRRVKRVVGVNESNLSSQDSLDIQLPTRRYERIRNRAEDEDLLIQRHWFDGLTFDPVQDQFDDLFYQRVLTLTRSEYTNHEGGRFPQHFEVFISTSDEEVRMSWEVIRIRFGRAYDFPFEIPEGYEQRLGF